MTTDPAALIGELLSLPENQRVLRLRSEGSPESLLMAACEEVDRLIGIEVARALAASELIVALADELRAPRVQAEARGAHAMALSYAGRLDDALASCGEAVAIAESAGLGIEAARARLASVHPLARAGRYDDAVRAAEVARDALFAAGEPKLAARADVSLGAVYDTRGLPREALRHYDRALPALAGDPTVVAQIETNRGAALMGLDEFRAAETAFAVAVGAFAEIGLDWAGAVAEGNLAFLATRQGRLEQALLHFERARRCLEADEAPADLARLLAEQADALALLGMPNEALRGYEQAIPRLEAHGLALEAAEARSGLGRVRLHLGQIDGADHDLASAAIELERLGHETARARIDLIRSELFARTGRIKEAQTLAEDALDALSLRPSDAAIAHGHLARLYLDVGDLSAALAHVAAALPIAERLDLAPLRARLLHSRGIALRRKGLTRDASRDLNFAVEQIERVRGVLQAERFRTAFLGSHLVVYEDAVLAALDSGGNAIAEAFALVERAKGRALLDTVGGTLDPIEVSGRVDPDPAEAHLHAEFTRVRSELNWHYSRIDSDADALATSTDRERWRAAVTRLEADFDMLEDRLAAARGVAGLFAPPLGLEAALGLVPAGAALVEYFVAGDEVMAFVLRGDHATVFRRLTSCSDLAERVGRVHFQIGRAVATAWRETSASRIARQLADIRRELGDLHERLVDPIADEIAGIERLIVVPQGALHTLPFHALWDGERYLIEKHEVVYAPSASVLAFLTAAGRRPAGGDGALVLGVPDGLAPWIETEAVRVADALGVAPILDSAATFDRFVAEAPPAGIIHVACHGRFVPDRPLASGLKLADRWLTVRDVYALRLSGSLITLSGCETGRAAVGGGDELVGLVRGFLAAGAGSLLLSLWVVNDESTAQLMTEFYGAYRRGVSPAAALRAAQCALLARKPHPAVWAPFILGGIA